MPRQSKKSDTSNHRVRAAAGAIARAAKRCFQFTFAQFTPGQSGLSSGEFFKIARDIVVVLSILSFFSGWIYINAFFRELGLKFPTVTQPVYYILMYSFSVLYQFLEALSEGHIPAWLFLSLALFGPIILIRRAGRLPSLQVVGCSIYIVSVALLVFDFSSKAGVSDSAYFRSGGGPHISFVFAKEFREEPSAAAILTASASDRLRFFWDTTDEYVVLEFIGTEQSPDVRTYRIAKKQVAAVNLWRQR